MKINLWTQGKGREEDRMKRTPELRTLSEDHHHGLVHARRLRRATEADEVDAAVKGLPGFLAKGHSPPLSQRRGGTTAGDGPLRRRPLPPAPPRDDRRPRAHPRSRDAAKRRSDRWERSTRGAP